MAPASVRCEAVSWSSRSGWKRASPQVLPAHVFVDDVEVLADLFHLVDGGDAGVVQPRGGAGFVLEALAAVRVAGVGGRQRLQGHLAAQARVLGAVDHAHPALAELLFDAIVGNSLPDHGRSLARAQTDSVSESVERRLLAGNGESP